MAPSGCRVQGPVASREFGRSMRCMSWQDGHGSWRFVPRTGRKPPFRVTNELVIFPTCRSLSCSLSLRACTNPWGSAPPPFVLQAQESDGDVVSVLGPRRMEGGIPWTQFMCWSSGARHWLAPGRDRYTNRESRLFVGVVPIAFFGTQSGPLSPRGQQRLGRGRSPPLEPLPAQYDDGPERTSQ